MRDKLSNKIKLHKSMGKPPSKQDSKLLVAAIRGRNLVAKLQSIAYLMVVANFQGPDPSVRDEETNPHHNLCD